MVYFSCAQINRNVFIVGVTAFYLDLGASYTVPEPVTRSHSLNHVYREYSFTFHFAAIWPVFFFIFNFYCDTLCASAARPASDMVQLYTSPP